MINIHTHLGVQDQKLVEEWYVKDTNAIPPVYVLQNINKDIHDPDNNPAAIQARLQNTLRSRIKMKEDDKKAKECDQKYKETIAKARGEWKMVCVKLQSCLRDSAKRCVAEGTMDDEQAKKYFWSGKQTCYFMSRLSGSQFFFLFFLMTMASLLVNVNSHFTHSFQDLNNGIQIQMQSICTIDFVTQFQFINVKMIGKIYTPVLVF